VARVAPAPGDCVADEERPVGLDRMDINDTTPEANVRDNSQAGRYEITREGRTAILAYRRAPGAIALVHTFVPPPLRARGLAKRLVAFALADARGRGERVIPECPFVQAYLQKHPEEARRAE
jgi:uncharacterized protein